MESINLYLELSLRRSYAWVSKHLVQPQKSQLTIQMLRPHCAKQMIFRKTPVVRFLFSSFSTQTAEPAEYWCQLLPFLCGSRLLTGEWMHGCGSKCVSQWMNEAHSSSATSGGDTLQTPAGKPWNTQAELSLTSCGVSCPVVQTTSLGASAIPKTGIICQGSTVHRELQADYGKRERGERGRRERGEKKARGRGRGKEQTLPSPEPCRHWGFKLDRCSAAAPPDQPPPAAPDMALFMWDA